MLLVQGGNVAAVGPAPAMLASIPDGAVVTDYRGKLILPGFVDTHVHYAQTDIIASYGAQLLEWLEKYTFPAEARFADPEHARDVAEFFVAELLRNGTTTAMVFATTHKASVDAIFEAARTPLDARHRRQGADGSQRSGGRPRHRRLGLRRQPGADRAVARSRAGSPTR